jgi:hypothetical protein
MIAVNYGGPRVLHRRIFDKTKGGTFFTTEEGYMAMGSDLTQPGDQVTLIAGVRLPMIIRPHSDGTYRIICLAYVYGVMNGEKWPDDTGRELVDWL